VLDKERGNFCDWFRLNPALRQGSAANPAAAKAADAKAAWDKLFS
jgi:hypothetical protein